MFPRPTFPALQFDLTQKYFDFTLADTNSMYSGLAWAQIRETPCMFKARTQAIFPAKSLEATLKCQHRFCSCSREL